jgi:hypothetical protein
MSSYSRATRVRRAHFRPLWQVASEKAELLAALVEYEKDINHLEALYNEHKVLLDQHCLDADMRELARYPSSSCSPLSLAARLTDAALYATSTHGWTRSIQT